jgi:hypothetical protein
MNYNRSTSSPTSVVKGSDGQTSDWRNHEGHTHSVNYSDHTHGTTEQRDHTHTVSLSGSTHGAGSGAKHTHPDIVPKYYTLAYIMKEYL